MKQLDLGILAIVGTPLLAFAATYAALAFAVQTIAPPTGTVSRFTITNKDGVATGVRVTAGALSCDISVIERPSMARQAAPYGEVTGICQYGTKFISSYNDIPQANVSVFKTLKSGSDSLTIQFDVGQPHLAWKATANGKSDSGTL